MTKAPKFGTDVSATGLREVMSHYLTGVTIVTVTQPDGLPYGLTVNSFNSVSLSPPLILWSLDNNNLKLSLFENADGFAVNIMAGNQLNLCKQFASQENNRFSNVDWAFGDYGQPLIKNALANIECTKWKTYAGGDHTIFVGEVTNAYHSTQRPAAAFYQGKLGNYDN